MYSTLQDYVPKYQDSSVLNVCLWNNRILQGDHTSQGPCLPLCFSLMLSALATVAGLITPSIHQACVPQRPSFTVPLYLDHLFCPQVAVLLLRGTMWLSRITCTSHTGLGQSIQVLGTTWTNCSQQLQGLILKETFHNIPLCSPTPNIYNLSPHSPFCLLTIYYLELFYIFICILFISLFPLEKQDFLKVSCSTMCLLASKKGQP